LSNAQLVGKYGFCLPYNPFDEVTLCDSWSGFISSSDETASGFKAPPKLKQAVKWLQKHRCGTTMHAMWQCKWKLSQIAALNARLASRQSSQASDYLSYQVHSF